MTATESTRFDATQVLLVLLVDLLEQTRDLLDDAVIDLREQMGDISDGVEPGAPAPLQ